MNVMFINVIILILFRQRIEEKLIELHEPECLEELQLPVDNIYDLDNNETLTLILYLIECEFHFTGDGIWTEQQTQPVENFNNLIPDFPESLNKVYKYGMKPSGSNQSSAHRTKITVAQN